MQNFVQLLFLDDFEYIDFKFCKNSSVLGEGGGGSDVSTIHYKIASTIEFHDFEIEFFRCLFYRYVFVRNHIFRDTK